MLQFLVNFIERLFIKIDTTMYSKWISIETFWVWLLLLNYVKCINVIAIAIWWYNFFLIHVFSHCLPNKSSCKWYTYISLNIWYLNSCIRILSSRPNLFCHSILIIFLVLLFSFFTWRYKENYKKKRINQKKLFQGRFFFLFLIQIFIQFVWMNEWLGTCQLIEASSVANFLTVSKVNVRPDHN